MHQPQGALLGGHAAVQYTPAGRQRVRSAGATPLNGRWVRFPESPYKFTCLGNLSDGSACGIAVISAAQQLRRNDI